MKLVRKIATLFLCMCLVTPCFTMMVHAAAEGTLSFENKEAEAGQEVTLSLMGKVDAGIGGRKITITYDQALLEFVSGTNTSKVADGELLYEASDEINSLYSAKEFCQLTFKALGNGTAKVGISTYDIKSSYEIEWTCHNAEVAISGGEPVETPDEEPAETPDEEPAETPDEEPVEKPDEEATDTTTETDSQVVISNTTTITLIEDVSEIVLSKRYNKTSVTMDGKEFPAWQDSVNTDMYIVYAVSSNGIKSLYQYDTLENTYQRFEVPEEAGTTVNVSDNVLAMFGDKANIVLIGIGALFVLFIILIIVLAVKLYNRNAELDEVYDDLDHALAEKEAVKKMEVTETEEDVVIETEEDSDEIEVEFYVEEAVKEFMEEEQMTEAEEDDDSEVEVEFYVDEPEEESEVEVEFYEEKPVIEESVEEPVVEEPVSESVDEPALDKTIRIPAIEEPVVKTTPEVEYYDEDDEFYDDMDGEFFVNFIDLDD